MRRWIVNQLREFDGDRADMLLVLFCMILIGAGVTLLSVGLIWGYITACIAHPVIMFGVTVTVACVALWIAGLVREASEKEEDARR